MTQGIRCAVVKIGLADVAARAQVSASTVSRVLNGRPGVNEATRRAVLTAVDVLGYERPAALRPRRTGLVGLIVPELSNPFFPRLADCIETALAKRRYAPVLCSLTLGGTHEDDYVSMLQDNGVVGIVIVSGIHATVDADPERYVGLLATGMPTVLVNGDLAGLPGVSTDDVAAGSLATSHLAHMGHRRIGLALGQERYTPAVRRREGFLRVMAAEAPEVAAADLVEHTTYTVEGGEAAALRLLDSEVTGIVCGSDVMALGAIRAARSRGLRVPEDVSVVGSDDGMLMEFTDPPLTTVRQPASALAERVCDFLVDQMAGVDPSTQSAILAPELVVRQSSARVRPTP